MNKYLFPITIISVIIVVTLPDLFAYYRYKRIYSIASNTRSEASVIMSIGSFDYNRDEGESKTKEWYMNGVVFRFTAMMFIKNDRIIQFDGFRNIRNWTRLKFPLWKLYDLEDSSSCIITEVFK